MEDLVGVAIAVVAKHPAVSCVTLGGSRSRGTHQPMGHFPVYQVLLRGPTKVEYLFLEHSQDAMPPVSPSKETLAAIDTHFWDWVWWLATQATVGREDLVAEHLSQLHGHLLGPLGVQAVPKDIEAAISVFVARRDELERDFGLSVPRALEEEVRRGIRRVGATARQP